MFKVIEKGGFFFLCIKGFVNSVCVSTHDGFHLLAAKRINEAVPSTLGAIIIFFIGSVTITEIGEIISKVSGASITIISTLIMALALESIGFFHWVAAWLLKTAKGSGIRLFWLINLLCFLMTLFLNNDGSILITTPILLLILRNLGMRHKAKLAYLISGALISTASSVPIGVSNIVNLISLEIVGMTLYEYTLLIFIPGMFGLVILSILLFVKFYKSIPKKIYPFSKPIDYTKLSRLHPLQSEANGNHTKRMLFVLLYVFLARISIFVGSYFGVSISLVAICSSILLLIWRWYFLKISPMDLLKKTPYHIFVFAFTMYIIVYGLKSIGLTTWLVSVMEPFVKVEFFYIGFIMGTVISVLSNFVNNHPALMIGTLTLTEIELPPMTYKWVYLANIIGSDIGALLLPTGTLATLLWLHILKQNKVKISWREYIKVTKIVIPITTICTFIFLSIWINIL